ncbi:MAG: universal stress protein [Actinomycetota bacterium]|nr:universal stress protein [Actinomycetota bacterium]
MRRILVVANLTLGGEQLRATLRERVAEGPCALHILVPASPDPTSWHSRSEEDDVAHARQRLEAALQRFRDLQAEEVTGEVGDPRPTDAITDVLRRAEFDEIVLSTLPPGVSRWLHADLVSRVERAVDLPVTHVITDVDLAPPSG